jgi:hypothetical protein
MNEPTPPAEFHGWFRPLRGRWRRVCAAPTWEQCYRELLDRTRGQSGCGAVCRAGRLPPGQPPNAVVPRRLVAGAFGASAAAGAILTATGRGPRPRIGEFQP